MNRIEVWCKGDPNELRRVSRLPFQERTATTGGFGAQFESRVFLDSLDEVGPATTAVFEVAYRVQEG